jgi:hypothetical protein
MDETIYGKHYIRIDEINNIIAGWSDGPLPDMPTDGAICINEKGGYQFRLFAGGEENPALKKRNGMYLYRYADNKITKQ